MIIPACLPQRLLNNWWICWFMERYREQERERPRGRIMSFPPHFHTFPPYVTMFLMFLPIFSHKYSMFFPYAQWEIKKDPYIWRYVNVPYLWPYFGPYFLGRFPLNFLGILPYCTRIIRMISLTFSPFLAICSYIFPIFGHIFPFLAIFSYIFWGYFP